MINAKGNERQILKNTHRFVFCSKNMKFVIIKINFIMAPSKRNRWQFDNKVSDLQILFMFSCFLHCAIREIKETHEINYKNLEAEIMLP